METRFETTEENMESLAAVDSGVRAKAAEKLQLQQLQKRKFIKSRAGGLAPRKEYTI